MKKSATPVKKKEKKAAEASQAASASQAAPRAKAEASQAAPRATSEASQARLIQLLFEFPNGGTITQDVRASGTIGDILRAISCDGGTLIWRGRLLPSLAPVSDFDFASEPSVRVRFAGRPPRGYTRDGGTPDPLNEPPNSWGLSKPRAE